MRWLSPFGSPLGGSGHAGTAGQVVERVEEVGGRWPRLRIVGQTGFQNLCQQRRDARVPNRHLGLQLREALEAGASAPTARVREPPQSRLVQRRPEAEDVGSRTDPSEAFGVA